MRPPGFLSPGKAATNAAFINVSYKVIVVVPTVGLKLRSQHGNL